jgi:hypothetical protein
MQSTLTPEETDPHDIFVIEPQVLESDRVVLAARVDKPAADQTPPRNPANPAEAILADILSRPSTPKLHVVPDVSIAARVPPTKPVPPVSTAFRATAATADAIANGIQAPVDVKVPSDIRLNSARPARGSWAKRSMVGFLFALGSVAAAEAWDHYGDTARQMIAVWTPVFTLPSSQPAPTTTQPALTTTAAAAQPAAPAVEAAVTDQTPSPPAPGAIQPAPAAAAATPAAVPDQTQALQSMTQDLAAMGQQIEALKASIAQLKAGQEQMAQQISRDMVRNAVVRSSEAKASEPRGRLSTLPPRPVPPVRKPVHATYAPATAAYNAPPPQPGPAYPPPMARAPMQVPPVGSDPDGDLVVRPPMPLR